MKDIVIILHNIRSLYNVGSIFRTADAAGVKKIFLCGITPTPLDHFGRLRPQLVKVSLGAEKTVPWEKIKNTSKLIDKLKNPPAGGGHKIWAVEQARNSIPYYRVRGVRMRSRVRIALVFGNEVKGISPAILKKADKILEIPMRGAMVRQARHPRYQKRGKESLNVAVAFGIVVFHFLYS